MNAAEPMIFTQVVMFVKLIQDRKIVAHNKKIIQAVTNAELIQEDSNVASRIQNIQVAMFVNYLQEVNYVVMLIQKMSHVYNAWKLQRNQLQSYIRHVVNQDQKTVVRLIQNLIQVKLILIHVNQILQIAQ